MNRIETLSCIQQSGLVAVVRADSADQAARIADACIEGGVAAIELTFTVPRADRLIEAMAARYPHGEIILGAGTVLDPETARIAILSGAQYIVSPAFCEETVRLCNRYGIPSMPGVFSPTEALRAMEAGADVLKIFPGEIATPAFVKALLAPLPHAMLMPSGGVTVDNAGDWIRAGAIAVGAGGALTGAAKEGDYAAITATARRFLQEIRKARQL